MLVNRKHPFVAIAAFALGGVLALPAQLLAQNTPAPVKRTHFRLAPNVTAADYMAGTLVLKVKEAHRSACST